MERPSGVTVIAILFFLASIYLCAIGIVMLGSRGTAPMTLGVPLLHGLELAGPFMFLLVGAAGALILLYRHRRARAGLYTVAALNCRMRLVIA